MTHLIVHEEVAADLTAGAQWYRDIDPELAGSFLEEVYLAIENARAQPGQYSRIYREYRRVLCERFPYKVVFEIVDEAHAFPILP